VKKIIAVILTVSFLAVAPAQADSPDRSVYAADQDRHAKADNQERSEEAASQERSEEAANPVLMVASARSTGGGIWCCLV